MNSKQKISIVIPAVLATILILVWLVPPKSPSLQKAVPRAQTRPRTRDAYVTMLYNDEEFVLGVRVLGQSLRESNTEMDYVVMCTSDVPKSTRKILESDGWIVQTVDTFNVSGNGIKPYFNDNLNKLKMYTLTNYRRIVWLDADAIVVKNVDELFKCGKFCASYRHSDNFNCGVMVLEPSLEELQKIINHIKDKFNFLPEPHSPWGDQIVLNSYYRQLRYASMLNFTEKEFHKEPMRLPAGYNADIAMYYLNNHWIIPKEELKIIHYTMWPVKPMKWWAYPLFGLSWKWYQFRQNLPFVYNEPSIYDLTSVVPLVGIILVLFFVYYCPNIYMCGKDSKYFHAFLTLLVPGERGWVAWSFPAVALFLSCYFAFYCVPLIMKPKEAWILYGIWLMFFIILLFAVYCHFLHYTGELLGRKKPNGRIKRETSALLLAFVVIFALQISIRYTMTCSFYEHFIATIVLYLVMLSFVCIAGNRILKIWFGS